jgi:hypothetical protein
MDAIPQIIAAVLVIGLLGILWWSSKNPEGRALGWFKFSIWGARPAPGTAQIQLLGRSHLTPNHQLHLVQSMEQLFLICTHSGGSSVISSQPIGRSSQSVASSEASL